jgi:D-alanyl-lipoteichoic acid acyltransferase DltB (MBOAT superfamily)
LLFPTFEFAVFFSLTFVVSWLLRPFPLPWRLFILAMSYVFYAWWDWRFCFLLAASSVGNWVAAEAIGRSRSDPARRAVLAGTVAANLAVLGFFKYYGFFVTSVTDGLGSLGVDVAPPLLQVVLPVGISFFTFQALSYVIDRYRDDTEGYPLLDFAVYLSFFPHLVAGPIVRARELLPQLAERPDPRKVDAALAFRLIFAGLFKKVVISSFVAGAAVDEVFAVPGQYRSLEILLAIYAYAIQIYADFSGYTDIAIGCALLLGLRFPQNFDAPYTALSIQDFWRRWHITLSTWLRDYVYIPLGGNQRGARRTSINLFLTMLLGGLWHGAAWTFVVWGAIHGGAMTVERSLAARRAAAREHVRGLVPAGAPPAGLHPGVDADVGPVVGDRLATTDVERGPAASLARTADDRARMDEGNGRRGWGLPGAAGQPRSLFRTDVVRWLVTFHVVCLAWVFFRAESLGDAFELLWRLVAAPGWGPVVTPMLVFVIIAMIASQFVPAGVVDRAQAAFSQLGPIAQGATLGVGLLLIDALGPVGVAPFIYFQF